MRTSPFLAVVALICAVGLAQEGPDTGAAAAQEPGLADVERFVNLGDKAYSDGDYQSAIDLYGRAAEIDPWHLDAGNRQILALLRSALARGDRGAAFENAVAAFEYVKGAPLPDDLASEVEALQEILANLPAENGSQPESGTPTAVDTVEVGEDDGGTAVQEPSSLAAASGDSGDEVAVVDGTVQAADSASPPGDDIPPQEPSSVGAADENSGDEVAAAGAAVQAAARPTPAGDDIPSEEPSSLAAAREGSGEEVMVAGGTVPAATSGTRPRDDIPSEEPSSLAAAGEGSGEEVMVAGGTVPAATSATPSESDVPSEQPSSLAAAGEGSGEEVMVAGGTVPAATSSTPSESDVPSEEPSSLAVADEDKGDEGEGADESVQEASAQTPSAIDVSSPESEVEAPVLIKQVAPVYPARAQRMGIEGDVKLRVLIGIDGTVKDIRIDEVPRRGMGFEEAVTAAVREWQFQPATEKEGGPIPAWIPIRVPFQVRYY